MRRWRWRRIQRGFISAATPSITERFEVNLYGLLAYVTSLSEQKEARTIHPADIVQAIGSTLYRAAFLLRETTMNLFIRVSLEGIMDYAMTTNPYGQRFGAPNPYQSIENHLEAERNVPREILEREFKTHVTDLIRQLMWAFDWADEGTITAWVAKIVESEWKR